MAPKLGYLLPTREHIMQGRPEAAPLLALAERAEALGYASVWVGDSLLARPRHEPLTLLAGVAGRVKRVEIGTAVLLPALRNPTIANLSLEGWVAVVRPGKILFEMEGVNPVDAQEAMRLASHKLPLRTKFVMRHTAH